MTTIFCTNKLEKFIGRVDNILTTDSSTSPLGDWNGHLFSLDRRKCLIFVNNRTYYTVLLTDILKKDLATLQDLFLARLIQQLTHDRLIDLRDNYLIAENFGSLTLARTNNDRRTIGTMNEFVATFRHHCFVKYDHLSQLDTAYENGLINTTPTGTPGKIKKTWSYPKENMEKIIKTLRTVE